MMFHRSMSPRKMDNYGLQWPIIPYSTRTSTNNSQPKTQSVPLRRQPPPFFHCQSVVLNTSASSFISSLLPLLLQLAAVSDSPSIRHSHSATFTIIYHHDHYKFHPLHRPSDINGLSTTHTHPLQTILLKPCPSLPQNRLFQPRHEGLSETKCRRYRQLSLRRGHVH